jgi:hypothetical protein
MISVCSLSLEYGSFYKNPKILILIKISWIKDILKLTIRIPPFPLSASSIPEAPLFFLGQGTTPMRRKVHDEDHKHPLSRMS